MTYTILHIDSSPSGDKSFTRKLTANIVRELQDAHQDNKVIARDLSEAPLPHLDSSALHAFFTPAEDRDTPLKEAVKLSDQAINELRKADVIVIGAPMWNFGIPSSLKAWIDHIVRAGQTFKYGPTGQPESLLPTGKKIIIASARGGIYSEGPMQMMDHQENYLKAVFGFIGLNDISFVRAEGVALGPDAVDAAMGKAQDQLLKAIQG